MPFHQFFHHFYMGAWTVTAITTFIAFWLSIYSRSGLSEEKFLLKEKINNYVDQFDFTAHITGIIGFLSFLLAGIAGLMDVSGYSSREAWARPIAAIFEGCICITEDETLATRVAWIAIGGLCFVFPGILRLYFVTYGGRRMYDQNLAIQLLYAEVLMAGFLILTIFVGAVDLFCAEETCQPFSPSP